MLKDKDWFENQLKTKSFKQIANELGTSAGNVWYQAKLHGLTSDMGKSASIKEALKKKYPGGRKGEQASNWKGGRTVSPGGYIWIWKPEHPRASNGRVFEHILVAEEALGRPIMRNEVVHHKNHKKMDNRPENLEVVTRSQHVHNHYDTGRKLVKRIEYLEGLLDDNSIKYKK